MDATLSHPSAPSSSPSASIPNPPSAPTSLNPEPAAQAPTAAPPSSSPASSSSSSSSSSSAFKRWIPSSHPPSHLENSNNDVLSSPSSPPKAGVAKLRQQSLVNKSTATLVDIYCSCNPSFRYIHRPVPRRCLTKPSTPACNNDHDNCNNDYILHVNDTLHDDHGNNFTVLDLLGTGTFGQVVKCKRHSTGEIVAVKVIKNQPAYFNQAWVEINILKMLHLNNPPQHTQHIVKFYAHFIFNGHLCLVFERLSINLYELLKQNTYNGINMDLLIIFVNQILKALQVLISSEIIHCDLKPENILLKSLSCKDLKLIDFGSACQLHYPVYSYVQSRFYRSPEILLASNTKYDSQIDMWSLGCVIAELFLGIPLFPGQNEMNMVCRIVEMLGDMPDRFLQSCRNTKTFFNHKRLASRNSGGNHSLFELKSIEQYENEYGVKLPDWKRFFKQKSLRDIIMTYPASTTRRPTTSSSAPPAPPAGSSHSASGSGSGPGVVISEKELEMRECLIDLLHGMLKVDPKERWTPAEALQHPFVKGEPLPDGQPWVPPSRPRRLFPGVNRSRPVGIQQIDHNQLHQNQQQYQQPQMYQQQHIIPSHQIPFQAHHNMQSPISANTMDGACQMYSASAPNFNAHGPLAHMQQQHSQHPHQQQHVTNGSGTSGGRTGFFPYSSNAAFSVGSEPEIMSPPSSRRNTFIPPFAPGSYVPAPPAEFFSSSFGGGNPMAHVMPPLPLRRQQQQQLQPSSGGSFDARSFYLHQQQQQMDSGVSGGLHPSASRESLTGSLRMSASKESLGAGGSGMGSANDLSQVGIFPFMPDDDFNINNSSGSNSNVPVSSAIQNSSQQFPTSFSNNNTFQHQPQFNSIAIQQQQQYDAPPSSSAFNQQQQYDAPPVSSAFNSLSAALPPPGPWTGIGTNTGIGTGIAIPKMGGSLSRQAGMNSNINTGSNSYSAGDNNMYGSSGFAPPSSAAAVIIPSVPTTEATTLQNYNQSYNYGEYNVNQNNNQNRNFMKQRDESRAFRPSLACPPVHANNSVVVDHENVTMTDGSNIATGTGESVSNTKNGENIYDTQNDDENGAAMTTTSNMDVVSMSENNVFENMARTGRQHENNGDAERKTSPAVNVNQDNS